MVQNHEYIKTLIKFFYSDLIEFDQDHNFKDKIKAVLGGDTTSLKTASQRSKMAVYFYKMMPLKHHFLSIVLHMEET